MQRPKYYDGSKWVDIAPSAAEFESHKRDGAAHGIGNKSLLKTTAKDSIVNSINELFTNANDGKTAVANAVTAKGVSASPSDTFSALATKIGQISTGKKWASGTANRSPADENFEFLASTSKEPGWSIEVVGLTFEPSLIVIFSTTATYGSKSISIYTKNKFIESFQDRQILVTGISNSNYLGTTTIMFKGTGNAYVSNTGFKLPMSSHGSSSSEWYAYE